MQLIIKDVFAFKERKKAFLLTALLQFDNLAVLYSMIFSACAN